MSSAVDYYAYVDASGCDGFNFKENGQGSTRCFVATVLFVKAEDEKYNQGLLLDIKKLVGSKPWQEVKSTTVRRHKKRDEIFEILSRVKGSLISYVAFKTRISDPVLKDTSTKFLSLALHGFPIESATKVIQATGIKNKIQIYIDRSKRTEETVIKDYLAHYEVAATKEVDFSNHQVNATFRDSKEIKLIQLADIFAGILREFFEAYEKRKTLLPCAFCKFPKVLCKSIIRKESLAFSKGLKAAITITYKESTKNSVIFGGITPFPPEIWSSLTFLDCLVLRNRCY